MDGAAPQHRSTVVHSPAQPTQAALTELRRGLIEVFNLNELQTLCFELRIDYENLSGEGKASKARELVLYCTRTSQLAQLLAYCQATRPAYPWPVLSTADTPLLAEPNTATMPLTILFLGADPTDATRLRLGEEVRSIQERLQMAEFRASFRLEQALAIRPTDLVQAILTTKPQLVHFAGHGLDTGELCLENDAGETQPVPAEALAALFALVADQVQGVLLNTCYAATQAQAIAQHIPYVIGMTQAIGDAAALAFTLGFYTALGAGKTIAEAYQFGRVQIQLQNIPEHLTPVLLKKSQTT